MSIKVHVLNFHGIHSHIEIVLENTSAIPTSYYGINRWAQPLRNWHTGGFYPSLIDEASSVYSFEIDADPNVISQSWRDYWRSTLNEEGILSNNCAVSAQWFLHTFAGIDNPNLSNVSWNHLALGILWPSFIPSPVTLPGRIMSNVQFHIDAQNNNVAGQQFGRLFLYASLALSTLTFAASIFALTAATSVLTGGLATIATAGLALTSAYTFFKANNAINAKNIYEAQQHPANELMIPTIPQNA